MELSISEVPAISHNIFVCTLKAIRKLKNYENVYWTES